MYGALLQTIHESLMFKNITCDQKFFFFINYTVKIISIFNSLLVLIVLFHTTDLFRLMNEI